ncbi:MAG TPA: hypothetical protein VK399_14755, partial [Longimicrobiaceae bacterium]|nr:hypothetical protein [Longimicrobiaceae bacterium]
MRDATAAELALLAAPDYQVSARVLVEDGAGVMRDLCDLDGEDRVEEVEGSVSVDEMSATCTVKVAREIYERSLAPLRADSPLNQGAGGAYAPLLGLSRELQVLVATHASGTAPAPGDWKLVFAGRSHAFNAADGEDLVSVTAADHARRLLRKRIELEEVYGSEEGAAVQAVMRAILDRWGFADVPLLVPVDPEWAVRPYKLAKGGSVLEALRTLAQGRGWDVRFRWSEAAGAFRLTLFQLDREPEAPVHEFTPDDILAVRRLEVDDADIRDAARVEFRNRSTGKREEVWEPAGVS